MKTIFRISFIFFAVFYFGSNLYSQTRNDFIRLKVDQEARFLCNKFNCSYYGNITLESADENDKGLLIVSGTLKYRSNNCGEVVARFNAGFKVILDEVEICCFVLHMPYCMLGGTLRYDAEYTKSGCGCY